MNLQDFCLCGHLTTLVLGVYDLKNRIISNCLVIRNTPGIGRVIGIGMFEYIKQSMRNRVVVYLIKIVNFLFMGMIVSFTPMAFRMS